MKLYLLERINETDWDEYAAKLIRAKNESGARELANKHTGDEGKIWNDSSLASCKVVSSSGVEEEIISDFNAG